MQSFPMAWYIKKEACVWVFLSLGENQGSSHPKFFMEMFKIILILLQVLLE